MLDDEDAAEWKQCAQRARVVASRWREMLAEEKEKANEARRQAERAEQVNQCHRMPALMLGAQI